MKNILKIIEKFLTEKIKLRYVIFLIIGGILYNQIEILENYLNPCKKEKRAFLEARKLWIKAEKFLEDEKNKNRKIKISRTTETKLINLDKDKKCQELSKALEDEEENLLSHVNFRYRTIKKNRTNIFLGEKGITRFKKIKKSFDDHCVDKGLDIIFNLNPEFKTAYLNREETFIHFLEVTKDLDKCLID